jgi:hypothetical protein
VSTETKVFGAVTLLCTLFIGGIIFYDIYTHPADPAPADRATIVIGGTEGVRFSGTVGTLREPLGITATTPVTVESPYRRADWVIADLHKVDEPTNVGTLRVGIVEDEQTVEQGETNRRGGEVLVMWDDPRSGQVADEER